MSLTNSNTKVKNLKHLTCTRHTQIVILSRAKIPKTKIAVIVGIFRAALYHELKRGLVIQKKFRLDFHNSILRGLWTGQI